MRQIVLAAQAAHAASKRKGSIFEILYRRLVPRLGHNQTIGAIAHRLCQLIWMILYKGIRYEERGPTVCEQSKQVRTARMIRTLRKLGYRVELQANPSNPIFEPVGVNYHSFRCEEDRRDSRAAAAGGHQDAARFALPGILSVVKLF